MFARINLVIIILNISSKKNVVLNRSKKLKELINTQIIKNAKFQLKLIHKIQYKNQM